VVYDNILCHKSVDTFSEFLFGLVGLLRDGVKEELDEIVVGSKELVVHKCDEIWLVDLQEPIEHFRDSVNVVGEG
jgi:hypothetical protein